MLKGVQREMVMVRTTDSHLFEMAYFVLRAGVDKEAEGGSLVSEANRIVSDICFDAKLKRTEKRKHRRKRIVLFLCGLAAGVAIGSAVMVMLSLL